MTPANGSGPRRIWATGGHDIRKRRTGRAVAGPTNHCIDSFAWLDTSQAISKKTQADEQQHRETG